MEASLRLKRLLYPSRGDTTELRFDGLSATVPDDERFNLCRELVLQRVYEVAGVPTGTVLDCGANVGMFTLTAFRSADRVVAVEPDPSNYHLLAQNVANSGARNIELLEAAVWTVDGEMNFDTGTHSTGGGINSSAQLKVKSVTLDTLCETYGPIDLLKLDIEGAEESVIPNSRLDGVSRIVAELHLRQAGDERAMIQDLEARGFQVEIVSAASLYRARWVKKVLRNWQTLEGEKLIKLGVIAYLLAPLDKPRRPGRDMPLLVARR